MKRDHYVICVWGYKYCTVLTSEGGTLRDARQAIAWQSRGGPEVLPMHICVPHETERGTFVSVETGAHFPVSRGARTKEAHAALLDRLWGPNA